MKKYALLVLIAIMVIIIVGRFSRIINPIDQIIITKSDDGKTTRAVTKNGDILSVKKKVNDLGYAVYINEKGIDSVSYTHLTLPTIYSV